MYDINLSRLSSHKDIRGAFLHRGQNLRIYYRDNVINKRIVKTRPLLLTAIAPVGVGPGGGVPALMPAPGFQTGWLMVDELLRRHGCALDTDANSVLDMLVMVTKGATLQVRYRQNPLLGTKNAPESGIIDYRDGSQFHDFALVPLGIPQFYLISLPIKLYSYGSVKPEVNIGNLAGALGSLDVLGIGFLGMQYFLEKRSAEKLEEEGYHVIDVDGFKE